MNAPQLARTTSCGLDSSVICGRVLRSRLSGALAAMAFLFAADVRAADEPIQITVVSKDPDNHFWTAMVEGAKEAAKDENVQITVATGRDQTDADGQIRAIEYAISRGDDAILIANNGPAVNNAIKKARAAGLYVIALDTPTTPPDLVNATFASDNFEAGVLIGKWTAGALGGKKATIAMLDLFADKVVGIDWQRDHGFLTGMGIKTKTLDLMSFGLPVVSTRRGAEGIDACAEDGLIVVDDERRFAEEVSALLSEPDRADRLGRAAREYVTKHHSWRAVGADYGRLLSEAATRAARPSF